MAVTRKRGGAKQHRVRVFNRNKRILQQEKKMKKLLEQQSLLKAGDSVSEQQSL